MATIPDKSVTSSEELSNLSQLDALTTVAIAEIARPTDFPAQPISAVDQPHDSVSQPGPINGPTALVGGTDPEPSTRIESQQHG